MTVWVVGIVLSLPNIIVIKYESTQTANGTWEQTCGEDWTYYEPVKLVPNITEVPDYIEDVNYDYEFVDGSSDSEFDSYFNKMMDILENELTPGFAVYFCLK